MRVLPLAEFFSFFVHFVSEPFAFKLFESNMKGSVNKIMTDIIAKVQAERKW
jgi:hypothetical protein